MNLRDLAERIHRLSPEERRELGGLLSELESEYTADPHEVRAGNLRPGFETLAAEVFAEHRELLARLAQ
jgi:hypothetical protein